MDPLHLCIALGPLAAYLLLLGVLNLSRRPFVTTGARDAAALGLAVMGFVLAGPMELFLPEAAANRFGGLVWVLLIAFYALCLTLLVLLMRPRLVIYNISMDQLRPIMANVVARLDDTARWAGESLVLPRLGVQLHIESFAAMRNIQLVSAGPKQSYNGWRQLEVALVPAIRESRSERNRYGFSLVFFSMVLLALITIGVINDPQAVYQTWHEMLRL